MTDKNLNIVNFNVLDNGSIRFEFQITNEKFENKNIKIKFTDPRLCIHLYTYDGTFSQNSIYWAAPPLPYSDTVLFEAFCENEKIFDEYIKINQPERLSILKKFPYLLNYHDTLIDITLVDEIYLRDAYNSELTPINKSDVVVDIGSNVGAFVYYAMKHKASKIYCCEPNTDCINVLKNHFDIYPNIFINQYAIADKNEDKELILLGNVDNGCSGGNFISDNVKVAWHDRNHNKQKIKGIEFLDFIKLNNIDFIDYLKVDCEGGEHYIFVDKNKHYLCDNVDKIVLEYHGQYQHLLDFFEKNNFTYKIKKYTEAKYAEGFGLIYAKNNKFI